MKLIDLRGVFAEVKPPSIQFFERPVLDIVEDRNAESTNFRCLKDFVIVATVLAKDGGSDGIVDG